MVPRLVPYSLFLAFSLGCTRGSTPTSTDNPLNSSPALAEQDAQVHTTVILTQEVDYAADGTINETHVFTTSYDRRGNALEALTVSNRSGSIIRRTTTSSFNKWGNVLEQTIESDWPENGPRDAKYWITTVETDKWGHPSRRVYLEDWDFDGAPDHETNTLSYPAYDYRGRPLQELYDSDNDGDGALETRTTNTMIYDQRGNVEELTSESDRLMDGSAETKFHTVSTYNQHGEVVHQITESYELGDTYTVTMTTTEFDGSGNPLTRVTDVDYAPADGTVDARHVITTTFDGRHRPVTQVIDSDFGLDGTIERRITGTYEYLGTLVPQSHLVVRELSSVGHAKNALWSAAGDVNVGSRLSKPER